MEESDNFRRQEFHEQRVVGVNGKEQLGGRAIFHVHLIELCELLDLVRRIIQCREKGLLMISAGTPNNIIRRLMPLIITDEQLENGLPLIEEGLNEIYKSEAI